MLDPDHIAVRSSCAGASLVRGQTQTRICATKAEAICQSDIDFASLGRVRHVIAVKVTRRIARLVEIQSRRQNVLLKSATVEGARAIYSRPE